MNPSMLRDEFPMFASGHMAPNQHKYRLRDHRARRNNGNRAMKLWHQEDFADIPAILEEMMRLRSFGEREGARDLRLDGALRPQVQ
jgi:hypothetical protein